MKKIIGFCTAVLLTLTTITGFSQNPENIDPGNVRGDEGTVYLWENPTYYIPVLVIVVLLVGLFALKKSKKS